MKIAIIGGGASGLLCAILVAKKLGNRANITIFEKNERILKKLLQTGNGKCNLSNVHANSKNFHGESEKLVEYVLQNAPVSKTLEIFEKLGVSTVEVHGGRVYPRSLQASAICDVLRLEADHLNIKVENNSHIVSFQKNKNGFAIFKEGESKAYFAELVVVSVGSKASVSNFLSYDMIKKFGINISQISPALCQLRAQNLEIKALSGIKVECHVEVFSNKVSVGSAFGEVLFTNYGVSGTAILEISRLLHLYKNISIGLDFFSELDESGLVELLTRRRENLPHLTLEYFLVGVINKRVGEMVLKLSTREKLSFLSGNLTDCHIKEIANNLKNYSIKITGDNGFSAAQATFGGVLVNQISEKTMECLEFENLYFIGEVLDVLGDCGGFNLQWAWSSSIVCASAIASKCL